MKFRPALSRSILPLSSKFRSRNQFLVVLAGGNLTHPPSAMPILLHLSKTSGLLGNSRKTPLTPSSLGGIVARRELKVSPSITARQRLGTKICLALLLWPSLTTSKPKLTRGMFLSCPFTKTFLLRLLAWISLLRRVLKSAFESNGPRMAKPPRVIS